MGSTGARTGWVRYGCGLGSKDHLVPEVRAEVDRRERLQKERRGRLLCEVHVHMYEHDVDDAAAMYVVFPSGAALGRSPTRPSLRLLLLQPVTSSAGGAR